MNKKSITVTLTHAEVCHISLSMGIATAHWYKKLDMDKFEHVANSYHVVIQKLTEAVDASKGEDDAKA